MTQIGKKLTEEHKKKISEAHKGIYGWWNGKHHTNETKRKISEKKKGQKPWNKGKTNIYSVETIKIMSEKKKGRKLPEEHIKHIADANRGKKHPHSEETKKKFSAMRKGKQKGLDSPVCDKEYLLKYGRLKSFEPYCYKFNNRRKEACRDFFGRMSIISGTLESDCRKRLSIHHTDHNKNQGCDGIPFNLVPMTTAENSKEKWNEQEYQDYINKTLREGFKWGIWNEQEYIEKVMYDE